MLQVKDFIIEEQNMFNKKLDVKFKKLHIFARIPEFKHIGDSGMDISAIQHDIIEPGEIKLIKTGLAIELPENTEAQIRSRSGLTLKHGIVVANGIGTIDSNFKGELGVILTNISDKTYWIEPGMRIAQLVICPVFNNLNIQVVDELSSTIRGENGFGSTGVGI